MGGPFEVDIFANLSLIECQAQCLRAEKWKKIKIFNNLLKSKLKTTIVFCIVCLDIFVGQWSMTNKFVDALYLKKIQCHRKTI